MANLGLNKLFMSQTQLNMKASAKNEFAKRNLIVLGVLPRKLW